MNAKLCILGCHNSRQEIEAAIVAEDWNDVVSTDFPARCGCPPINWEELRLLLPEGCTQLLILGRSCLAGLGDPPIGFPSVRLLPQEQCFNMIAPGCLVNQAIEDGGYLITPGWLADWRGQLAKMGFEPETSSEFFKDFARQLVYFDTGVDPDASARLAELADIVGLPTVRLAVGLDTTRLLLASAVLEWRLGDERRNAQEQKDHFMRELADHVAAMDMLASLTRTQQETQAIAAIEELFRMLFAPAIWHYVPIERGKPIIDPVIPADLTEALWQMDTPYAWIPSNQGFLLRIARDEHVLGLIVVDNFAFPAYRERYLNLALAMTGVFALAIENARTRKRLVETEKLASLGVMVAGMAHEINTPLGVSLTAATTLQEQSRQLAQLFAERSMTQSDLHNYLATTQSEVALMNSSLDRISQLVDAFRQVALEGKPLSKRRFRLKICLDDVIASLGKQLSPERIDLQVDCDEELEIESYPGDWASILTNLITNSLRHGFKGRDHGRIEIAIAVHDGKLVTDYSDNGVGLSKEIMARIFSPFFTTDLQNGTGLGMFLVYNLVIHRLGGSIDYYSQPGLGVHFHIETPL